MMCPTLSHVQLKLMTWSLLGLRNLQLANTSAYYIYLLLLLKSALHGAFITFRLCRWSALCVDRKSFWQVEACRAMVSPLFPVSSSVWLWLWKTTCTLFCDYHIKVSQPDCFPARLSSQHAESPSLYGPTAPPAGPGSHNLTVHSSPLLVRCAVPLNQVTSRNFHPIHSDTAFLAIECMLCFP